MRHIFDKSGGKLGTDGSVAWIFERKGVIFVSTEEFDEDEVMLAAIEAGAEDVLVENSVYEIRTEPTDFMGVRQARRRPGSASRELNRHDPLDHGGAGGSDAKKTLRLLENLEDHDDVQDVYANYDIPDEVMEGLAG